MDDQRDKREAKCLPFVALLLYVTEFIRVNIDAAGSIWIAMGDEPK